MEVARLRERARERQPTAEEEAAAAAAAKEQEKKGAGDNKGSADARRRKGTKQGGGKKSAGGDKGGGDKGDKAAAKAGAPLAASPASALMDSGATANALGEAPDGGATPVSAEAVATEREGEAVGSADAAGDGRAEEAPKGRKGGAAAESKRASGKAKKGDAAAKEGGGGGGSPVKPGRPGARPQLGTAAQLEVLGPSRPTVTTPQRAGKSASSKQAAVGGAPPVSRRPAANTSPPMRPGISSPTKRHLKLAKLTPPSASRSEQLHGWVRLPPSA